MIKPLPAAPVSICRLVKSFAYDAATDHYIVAVVPDIGNLISAHDMLEWSTTTL